MKALTMERTVFLILAVIFFILAVFVIFKIFPNLLLQIQLALGIVKLSNAEKAILCSIYRCVEGCMSMKVQELNWKEGNEVKTCQHFCTGVPYGVGGDLPDDAYVRDFWGNIETSKRVCNPKYPVIFKTKDKEKIEKSHLQLGHPQVKDVGCIILSNEKLSFKFEVKPEFLIKENVLVVDNDTVSQRGVKEDCAIGGTIRILGFDSFKELEVGKDKTIKIITRRFEIPGMDIIGTDFFGEEKYEKLWGK